MRDENGADLNIGFWLRLLKNSPKMGFSVGTTETDGNSTRFHFNPNAGPAIDA